MIYEHNLNPVAVEFFSLKIFGILYYILGFIFCYYSKYLIKQKLLNLELSIIDDLITWLIVAVYWRKTRYVIF